MRISDWSSDVCSSDLTPATSGDRATPTTIPTARRVTMSGAVVTIAQEASAITATQANTTADIGSMSTTTGSGLGGASPSPDALVTIGTVRAGGCDPGDPRARARPEEHPSELQSLMRTSYAVFCL